MKKHLLTVLLILSHYLITGCQTAQNEANSVEEATTTTIGTSASTTTTSTTSTTSTSTTTTTTTSTTTPPSGTLEILGSINKVEDYFGNTDFYGEIINNSSGNASFVEITITMKNASGSVIDTDSTFINGTVLILNSSGIDTGSCLRPGEYGAFWVNTSTDFSDVASFEYDLDWSTYSASNPSASLEVIGTINETTDFSGNRKFLGGIRNNSSTDARFVIIYFICKNSTGKIINISSSYITGTDLSAGETNSFEVSTGLAPSEIASYYYLFDWSE